MALAHTPQRSQVLLAAQWRGGMAGREEWRESVRREVVGRVEGLDWREEVNLGVSWREKRHWRENGMEEGREMFREERFRLRQTRECGERILWSEREWKEGTGQGL